MQHWKDEPNYAILVDERDRPGSQITYVPEENIEIVSNTKVKYSHCWLLLTFLAIIIFSHSKTLGTSGLEAVQWSNTYLLLAECEVHTASYGLSFFLPFMAQARSARAMKTRKEKTRIHNLPYRPSKRG